MKKIIYLLLSFFSFCCYTNAQKSIIDDLNTTKTGQGKVTIYQDDAIKNLLGTPLLGKGSGNNNILNQLNTTSDENNETSKKYVKARGYRIQVYSGSDQKRSKNEAQYRRNTIQSSFPNMEVSVTYNSPVWRVKAGNFKTREQASQALSEMKARFPGLGREMYIVNDVVKIPVD